MVHFWVKIRKSPSTHSTVRDTISDADGKLLPAAKRSRWWYFYPPRDVFKMAAPYGMSRKCPSHPVQPHTDHAILYTLARNGLGSTAEYRGVRSYRRHLSKMAAPIWVWPNSRFQPSHLNKKCSHVLKKVCKLARKGYGTTGDPPCIQDGRPHTGLAKLPISAISSKQKVLAWTKAGIQSCSKGLWNYRGPAIFPRWPPPYGFAQTADFSHLIETKSVRRD
jgi:hypothetical protein